MCTGFSIFLWALNSLLIYSSPNSLISLGKCFLCARKSRLYRGIGGSSAKGEGLKPLFVPADACFANDLPMTLIIASCFQNNW